MKLFEKKLWTGAIFSLFWGVLAPPASASGGFAVPNFGGVFEGPSVPSEAAIYWNPAAIAPLKGTHLSGAISPTFLRGSFDRDGINPNTGLPFQTADWKGFGPIPTVGATSDFHLEHWVFGLGLFVPFGASVDYGDDDLLGAQRYYLVSASVVAFQTTPTVAYKILPNLSVGAGIGWVHTQFSTSLSTDLAAALSNVGVSAETAGSGYEDPLVEAYVETNTLRDNSLAWDVGVFYQPNPNWDLGISYRSEVSVSLTGSADIQFPPFPPEVGSLIGLGPITPGSQASADLVTRFRWPQSVQAGATYRFRPNWQALATLQWMNWSRFGRYETEITSLPLSQSAIDLSRARGLRDSVLLAAGVSHDLTREITVGGKVFYESPSVPTSFVNPQNLDFHTIGLGVGGKYLFSNGITLGLSYAHLFFIPRNVTGSAFDPRDPAREGFNLPNADGHYSAGLDKLDLSVGLQF